MNVLLLTTVFCLATATGYCNMDKKETSVENGCTIEKYTIHSPSMNRDIRIVVVLPPAYASSPDETFPILHALHGYGAPYDTWSQMASLRKTLAECPMIVTCLDGDKGSWYLDSPLKTESQFETFFFAEFIPYLDKHYRVDATRRAVTGFSMGGSGAFHYMLARPELFKSVSSLSGAFYELTPPNETMKGYLEELIGSYDEHPDLYEKLDCNVGIRKADKLPPIYLHCGTEDFLIEVNRRMHTLLKAEGFQAEYKETEGAHDWSFWKAAAPEVIRFHWKHGMIK
jgi:S-formylglutathione hydrolase FrmB